MLREIKLNSAERRLPPPLTRAQMKDCLLPRENGHIVGPGVAGTTNYIGSLPLPAERAVREVVLAELARSGYLFIPQGPSGIVVQGMNVQIWYHPDFGLALDGHDKIQFDLEKADELANALQTPFDFHPEASPGLYLLQSLYANNPELRQRTRLVKTQLATPSCSQPVFTDADAIDGQWYSSLVRGHSAGLRVFSDVILVEADSPADIDPETLVADLSKMFGDRFEKGKLVEPGLDVLRGFHSCEAANFKAAMATGAVDMIHFDALLHPNALAGYPATLADYLAGQRGMIAIGIIPQTADKLGDFAKELGAAKSIADYNQTQAAANGPNKYLGFQLLIDYLTTNHDRAVEELLRKFYSIIEQVQKDTGLSQGDILKQTFVAATCGMGSLVRVPQWPHILPLILNLNNAVADKVKKAVV